MKGFMVIFLTLIITFLNPAHCATYYVPDDFPTIQAAIYAASDGDEIVVRAGVYYESINFRGKALYLHSLEGPEVTTIWGQPDIDVVTFQNGENENSIIEGFTIRNGNNGISCVNSSPTIRNNTIMENASQGIMYRDNSSPTIVGNVIRNNGSDGISCYSSSSTGTIMGNVIFSNHASGISSSDSSPIIINNTIANNNSVGIYISRGNPKITNCILVGNNVGIYGIYSSPQITYCDFLNSNKDLAGVGAGQGCIFVDPIFINPDDGDYRISQYSPCRDGGDPNILDPDGTRSDIGAYGGENPGWTLWELELDEGWNLISIPTICPYGEHASAVLESLIQGGNTIYNNIYEYTPGIGYARYPLDFTEIERGYGYWVLITNPGIYQIRGFTKLANPIPLYEGWNLIGYPYTQEQMLDHFIIKQGDTEYTFQEAVDAGLIPPYLFTFSVDSGYTKLTLADSIQPWFGYWVLTFANDLELIVPTP